VLRKSLQTVHMKVSGSPCVGLVILSNKCFIYSIAFNFFNSYLKLLTIYNPVIGGKMRQRLPGTTKLSSLPSKGPAGSSCWKSDRPAVQKCMTRSSINCSDLGSQAFIVAPWGSRKKYRRLS
jgi:hypothetical protein